MKKTLALILAVLVAFSMFSFATIAADGDLVNVTFMNNGKVYHSIDVRPGEALTPYVPADPTREPDVDANGNDTIEDQDKYEIVLIICVYSFLPYDGCRYSDAYHSWRIIRKNNN